MYRLGNDDTSLLILPPGVFTSTGTEIAYPLSSIRKSTGSLRLHAVLSASQNSPSDVWPSPDVQSTISSSWNGSIRSRIAGTPAARQPASAQPTAWRNCVPVGEDVLTMRSLR